MTVFVDDWYTRARVGRLDRVWAHMFVAPEDEIGELHTFAQGIKMRREWFQGPPEHPWPLSHYDVTEGKRWQAIRAGAVELSWHDLGDMITNAKQRRVDRATELAIGNGHQLRTRAGWVECGQCLRIALKPNLRYGTAAASPCHPPWPVLGQADVLPDERMTA